MVPLPDDDPRARPVIGALRIEHVSPEHGVDQIWVAHAEDIPELDGRWTGLGVEGAEADLVSSIAIGKRPKGAVVDSYGMDEVVQALFGAGVDVPVTFRRIFVEPDPHVAGDVGREIKVLLVGVAGDGFEDAAGEGGAGHTLKPPGDDVENATSLARTGFQAPASVHRAGWNCLDWSEESSAPHSAAKCAMNEALGEGCGAGHAAGSGGAELRRITFAACGPFSPCSMSNSTGSSSLRDL